MDCSISVPCVLLCGSRRVDRQKSETEENTPKKDFTDLLAYKINLADRLLQGNNEVEEIQEYQEDILNLEVPPKRK